MFTDPSLTLAGQLFWIVDCFHKTMAPEACKRRIGSLSIAIWCRVKGFERRFCALYAQWKAGTLPKARRAVGEMVPLRSSASSAVNGLDRGERSGAQSAAAFDAAACDAATLDRARLRPASVLPRTFAWLHKLLPVSAPPLVGGLESLIHNYAEMKEFVAAAPQAGRILRPFCHMVGLKPPEWLALPKRKRKPRAAFSPSPAKRRRAGVGADVTRLSSVAYGHFLHPENEKHPVGIRPPNRIGYARSRWPPKNRD